MSSAVDSLLEMEPESRHFTGVVIGLVTNNNDKEGLGRVKVKFPWLSNEDESNWARVATPMAGRNRGLYLLPEIDDEVLVMFEHGDLRRPFVIGCVWNGKDRPPDDNADGQNNLRLFRTRSGHTITFSDEIGDQKIDITDSSGNNWLVIDTASNTITLTAAQDIVLSAPDGAIRLHAKTIHALTTEDIKLEAARDIDIKADSMLDINGLTVNIN